MRRWSPSGAFIAVCIVLVMMDESAAMPMSATQEEVIASRTPTRKLLQSASDMDALLSQAERLGSGEQTLDDLTGQPDQPRTMGLEAAPKAGGLPEQPQDALALFKLEADRGPAASPAPQNTALSGFINEGAAAKPAMDPLSQFQREKAQVDQTSAEAGQLESATAAAAAEADREKSLLRSLQPAATSAFASPLAPARAAQPSGEVVSLDDAGGLNNALAQFDKEVSAPLTPVVAAHEAILAAPKPESFNLGASEGADPDDDDEEGDLGESDSVDDSDSGQVGVNTQASMNHKIDQEAAEAAKSVLKETMKTVENEFLSSEKELTKDTNAPELTLDALRKPSATAARAAAHRKQAKAKAKAQHQKMKLQAKLAYDRAIAAAHKTAKEQLDHVLSGLRMQFSVQKKSVSEEAKIKTEQAKQKMLDKIRTAEIVAVNRLQATLPLRLAQVKQKAEAEAQHAASLAIAQITEENKKIRSSLETQLGEANEHLNAARLKLSGSDANPQAALQNAVAVKNEKKHVERLGELATVAMSQQKARSATEVAKAQQDAKESVRLAMKAAQKKEMKRSRVQMAAEQGKIRNQAELAFDDEKKLIAREAKSKVTALQKHTKELVDAAMLRAPLKEQELHRKATQAYKETVAAADNFLAKKMEENTPDITVTDGSTVNRDIAESAIENPTQSKAFTLENQNFEAAAKFAASKARKAQRKLAETKRKSTALMKELAEETKAAQAAAQRAEALDEKVTRIKLAKLQLHEAQAASAFNKAARAHLEEEVAKKQMSAAQEKPAGEREEFKKHLEGLQKQARATTVQAFKEAKKSATALTQGGLPTV